MFPNPANNEVYISVVKPNKEVNEFSKRNRLSGEEFIENNVFLEAEFVHEYPVKKILTQNRYTIQVYNALTGVKIEQYDIYADILSNLAKRIAFTSLNTANYRDGIYLVKVISETENILISGKLSIKH
jgi:hypothetical protein